MVLRGLSMPCSEPSLMTWSKVKFCYLPKALRMRRCSQVGCDCSPIFGSNSCKRSRISCTFLEYCGSTCSSGMCSKGTHVLAGGWQNTCLNSISNFDVFGNLISFWTAGSSPIVLSRPGSMSLRTVSTVDFSLSCCVSERAYSFSAN